MQLMLGKTCKSSSEARLTYKFLNHQLHLFPFSSYQLQILRLPEEHEHYNAR